MVEIVREEKEKIIASTNRISEILINEFDEEQILLIRKEIQKIVSSLSIIAGFCDKSFQEYSMRISNAVAEIISLNPTEIGLERHTLELFCTMVNTIQVDFGRTPFSFSAGFKTKMQGLEAAFKAAFKRYN